MCDEQGGVAYIGGGTFSAEHCTFFENSAVSLYAWAWIFSSFILTRCVAGGVIDGRFAFMRDSYKRCARC